MSIKRRAICVLGMHRSGTSAVTRVLNLLGADLPSKLMPRGPDNETGFWEGSDFVALSDEALQSMGLAWDSVSDIPFGWYQAEIARSIESRIVQLLEKDFEGSSLFVLKDPRMCRLVPLWLSALGQFGAAPSIVIVIRNPIEVMESLGARNGFSNSKGALLWLRHVLEAEYETRGLPRTVILYEQLLSDWRGVVARIGKRLRISWAEDAAVAAVQQFISTRQRHHTVSDDVLEVRQDIADWVKRTYRAVRQAACSQRSGANARELDRVRIELRQASLLFDPLIAEANNRIEQTVESVTVEQTQNTELRRKIEHLETEVSRERAVYRTRVAELESHIHMRREELAELRGRAGQLEAQVGEQNARVAELIAAAEARSEEIGRFRGIAEALQQQIRERDAQLEAAQSTVEAQRDEISRLTGSAEALQQQIRERDAQLEEERALMKRLEAQVKERDERLIAEQDRAMLLEEGLRYRESQVSEILNSTSWRLTAPLRTVSWAMRKSTCMPRVAGRHTAALARRIYRRLPLSVQQRQSLKELLFGRFAFLFRNSDAFWRWRQERVESDRVKENSRRCADSEMVTCAGKEEFTRQCSEELDRFLSSRKRLSLPATNAPKVSIVLVLFNRAELTFRCLRSLLNSNAQTFEVVIVDNNSTDATRALLGRLDGAKIIYNDVNKGFLLACNQSLEHCQGEHVLFLNNDTIVLSGSIDAAVRTLESDSSIGAVGAKIVMLDGVLQEAGSIVWQDGSCFGYGRGDDPFAPAYMFRRDVDYCSGAFLLTRRSVLQELGGFDESYAPAYYEESDYCLRLQDAGYRVVFEPDAVIQHYEFASSSEKAASDLMERNKALFRRKHSKRLQHKFPPDMKNVLAARHAGQPMHLLYVEDRIPHRSLGSGFPRANSIVSTLNELGVKVTLFATDRADENWDRIYVDLPKEVEVIKDSNRDGLSDFLERRRGLYDAILVSRPHNMELVCELKRRAPELLGDTFLIYDAEAVFAVREIAKARIIGRRLSEEEERSWIRKELALTDFADAVIAVSEAEKRLFLDVGAERVHVVGHTLDPAPTAEPFGERKDILFVGAIYDDESPNADSVRWFAGEIFPSIQKVLGKEVRLVVVGPNRSKSIAGLASDSISIEGQVSDLVPYYGRARIFVAPTRYAAGIPHKVHEAAARGVPAVVTELLRAQLGWKAEEDVLAAAANDAQSFAARCIQLYRDKQLWWKLRANALRRVEEECSKHRFRLAVSEVLAVARRNMASRRNRLAHARQVGMSPFVADSQW